MTNIKVTENINSDTGEYTKNMQYVSYKKAPTEKFIMVYLESVVDITSSLNPLAIKLLYLLWRDCTYSDEVQGNIIYAIAHFKNTWVNELGSKIGSVNNALTEIASKGFMKKVSTSVYILNPEYFYKGERNSRFLSLENFKKDIK